MNIDFGQAPKWIFSVAALLVAAVLFYTLVWPAYRVDLGVLGQIGRAEKNTNNAVPIFKVQRFGAKGRAGSLPGDELDYTAANNDTLIASRKEFPICYISSVSVGVGAGNCSLIQSPQDDWRIYVTGIFGCKVTCLRVDPGSQ